MSRPCLEKIYLEASARDRLDGILDKGTFREFIPPTQRKTSPHLGMFDLPVQFDDGVVIGEGKINGEAVCIAAQEGKFMGGALGEVHSAKIIGLLRRCLKTRPVAVVFLLDSGGVRLQEANAGEIGVAEIVNAVFNVRNAGMPVIGLAGGSCGCFGGMGIIAGCCDYLIISEEGRLGVSGPEVIETTMGVDAFDSRNKALVWRTTGGKNRYIFGFAGELVNNTIPAFRKALEERLHTSRKVDLATLEKQQERLEKRLGLYGECGDAFDIWEKMGFKDPRSVPEIHVEELREQLQAVCERVKL